MRPFVGNCQLAEVLVQGYEDALLMMGDSKNLVVAGVLRPITGPRGVVPRGLQLRYGTTPDTGYPGAASSISRYQERLDSFAAYEATGINQTGENVLALQPRVTLEQGFVIITSRQHAQDMLDG